MRFIWRMMVDLGSLSEDGMTVSTSLQHRYVVPFFTADVGMDTQTKILHHWTQQFYNSPSYAWFSIEIIDGWSEAISSKRALDFKVLKQWRNISIFHHVSSDRETRTVRLLSRSIVSPSHLLALPTTIYVFQAFNFSMTSAAAAAAASAWRHNSGQANVPLPLSSPLCGGVWNIILIWLLAHNDPPPPSSLWGGRRGRFFVPIREPGLMCQWQQSGQDWGLSIDFFSPTGAVGLSPIMMCNCNWLVVMSCSVHRALFWVVLFRHQIEETDWNGKGSPELVK